MKRLFILFFMLTSVCGMSQIRIDRDYGTDGINVLLHYECREAFQVYSDSGEVIGFLENHFENELWPVITVFRAERRKLYVYVEGLRGWIDRDVPLCIQPRGYVGEAYKNHYTDVPLNARPSECSKIKWIDSYDWLMIVDYDFKGGWLKVAYRDQNGVLRYGWLSPHYQCPNPYSTCN